MSTERFYIYIKKNSINNPAYKYCKFLVKNLINDNINYAYSMHIGQDSIIFGSSMSHPNKIKDYCLVRGKCTLDKIKKAVPLYDTDSIKLGDPGLLLSYFLDTKEKKSHEYGLIPHYTDKAKIAKYFTMNTLSKMKIIDICSDDIKKIAKHMLCCKKIISSSLYGIIFAHSLGIPAYWIRFPDSDINNNIFYDYLSIFGSYSDTCNVLNKKYSYGDILTFKPININMSLIRKKKEILMDNIIVILKKYGHSIKSKYDGITFSRITGIHLLSNVISNKTNKFLINRIGGVEFKCYCDYINNGYNKNSLYFKNMFKYCGYYDLDIQQHIFEDYIKEYEKSLLSSSLTMYANLILISHLKGITISHPKYICTIHHSGIYDKVLNKIQHIMKIPYSVLEDTSFLHIYLSLLNDKKILIISPFENEIRNQLKRKNMLFNIPNFTYPNFKKVEYVNTYLTTNNYQTPHRNWLETFNYYKELIKEKDFDIALLICGCYAYPIANYIYNTLHKSTIHVGGIGQLWFGIKGGRFLCPCYMQLMNKHWIFPYTIIKKNAIGVPAYDGLLGYFKRL